MVCRSQLEFDKQDFDVCRVMVFEQVEREMAVVGLAPRRTALTNEIEIMRQEHLQLDSIEQDTNVEALQRKETDQWLSKRSRVFFRDTSTETLNPMFRKSSEKQFEFSNDPICCICLDIIENNQRIVELVCEHLYHE